MSQEKLQTMIMQNFGGLKRCIMGFVQVEIYRECWSPKLMPRELNSFVMQKLCFVSLNKCSRQSRECIRSLHGETASI